MTALQKRWAILPPAPAEHLTGFPDLSPLLVQLLYNRQVRTREEIAAFLSKSLTLDNPFLLKGMSEAVTRLRRAIRAGESIAVYGDYDVDGVSATALLVPTLRALGAKAMPYIPKRAEEGYGLNKPALEELARQGFKLVVTVDCGVRSVEEAAYARQLGLDMIITDHHTVFGPLPPAVAVIDPKREDDSYPFKQLAGVGLAFKLAQALLRVERQVPISKTRELPQEEDLLDLVALGTVADLAPLTGENRALVSRGLEKLNATKRPGIAAMLKEAGLAGTRVDTTKIGFVLGPRLNAAGRLDDAIASYNLLTTPSEDEAAALAQQLGAQNQERQRRMKEMIEWARSEVQALGDDLIYVLASPEYVSADYMVGIAGLVAGRIMEEFYRPTIVIAKAEEESRGSARSIEGLHITKALDECRELLVRHGGHAAAAGFSIKNDNIDELRSRLREIAARQLTPDKLVPVLEVDMELPLNHATLESVRMIEELQPFGVDNTRPTFVTFDVQVRDCRLVGAEQNSVKFCLSDGTAFWDAIAFRQTIETERAPRRIDVVYTLQSRVWNGEERVELVVKDWRPAAGQA